MSRFGEEASLDQEIKDANKKIELDTKKLLALRFKDDKLYKKLDDPDKIINLMYDLSLYFPPYVYYKQSNAVFHLYCSLLDYCENIGASVIDEDLIYYILEEDTLIPEPDAKKYLAKAIKRAEKDEKRSLAIRL